MNPSVAAWENEGGAAIAPSLERRRGPLYGTPSQIEWAERIRVKVDEEFDRIASSFRSVANQQSTRQRAETEAILAIIEEKRSAVLAIDQASASAWTAHDVGPISVMDLFTQSRRHVLATTLELLRRIDNIS
jgi:hypothetical protein